MPRRRPHREEERRHRADREPHEDPHDEVSPRLLLGEASIQIYRIREGQIVLFRDFANPRVLEDVIREPRPES